MRHLSIETGIRCGNRCRFCFQSDLRGCTPAPPEPTTEELAERLQAGRGQGYEAVGFSGGEPTARGDFLDLVRLARRAGYGRIALTTNGQRLADDGYRRALLDAGIDSIGWSVHGATAATHDALTGVPGSFDRSVLGLRASLADARSRGSRLDVNLFTVINRLNRHEVVDICTRFRSLGVRLFVLQPLHFARGNLERLKPLHLPPEAVVETVRQAQRAAAASDFRIKPFNLPRCLFRGEGLEMPAYRVDVVRAQRSRVSGELRPKTPSGFVRLSCCPACVLRDECPGLPASLISQESIRATFETELEAREPGQELWVGGLELAEAETLTGVLREARRRSSRLVFCTGAGSVLGADVYRVAVAGGVDAVRFVVHRKEPRSGDLRRAIRGNLADVAVGLEELALAPGATRVERAVGMLLEPSERGAQALELATLVAGGAQRIHLEVANGDPRTSKRLGHALALVMGRWGSHAWARRAAVQLDIPTRIGEIPKWQRVAANGRCRVVDVRDRFVHTAFSGPSFGWVTDSVPAVALPGEYHEVDRWPAHALGPLVVPARPLGARPLSATDLEAPGGSGGA